MSPVTAAERDATLTAVAVVTARCRGEHDSAAALIAATEDRTGLIVALTDLVVAAIEEAAEEVGLDPAEVAGRWQADAVPRILESR
jgi:hypothetical protein